MRPDDVGIQRWLGRGAIANVPRGEDEPLVEYLLRHTRQIPRDVIHLGNELCAHVTEAKAQGADSVSPESVRSAVAVVSKQFADEQIAVCGNHIASDSMPATAGRHNYSEFYTSGFYTDTVQTEVRRFIESVGVDRFPLSMLTSRLKEAGGGVFGAHPSPLDVLWLNGLLGYEPPDDEENRSHFYGADDVSDPQLPENMQTYVFHPIVAHTVYIKAAGRPVRPFR
jgi:hypothetical protein